VGCYLESECLFNLDWIKTKGGKRLFSLFHQSHFFKRYPESCSFDKLEEGREKCFEEKEKMF
jgi:hypothetical protein